MSSIEESIELASSRGDKTPQDSIIRGIDEYQRGYESDLEI